MLFSPDSISIPTLFDSQNNSLRWVRWGRYVLRPLTALFEQDDAMRCDALNAEMETKLLETANYASASDRKLLDNCTARSRERLSRVSQVILALGPKDSRADLPKKDSEEWLRQLRERQEKLYNHYDEKTKRMRLTKLWIEQNTHKNQDNN